MGRFKYILLEGIHAYKLQMHKGLNGMTMCEDLTTVINDDVTIFNRMMYLMNILFILKEL